MQLSGKQLYDSLMHGAFKVIEHKEVLNQINVFPIQDGDTGSNLSSMMQTIITKSEYQVTIKKTLESIADAALTGARGNSGIIFAQYFKGLSESIAATEQITILDYAYASTCAAQYAYDAVEHPVEGTILTLMREWGEILSEESTKNSTLLDVFNHAFHTLELVLEKTKEQLSVLKKANVVDSGAKGFTYFIEGALHYLKHGDNRNISHLLKANTDTFDTPAFVVSHIDENEIHQYCTECLFECNTPDIEKIKSHLKNLGSSLVVADSHTKCRVHIHTNSPSDVFDYLSDFGTLIYQKVDDMFHQREIINNRKYKIALVTDSIADLPKELIQLYQIHVIPLDILFHGVTYFDKLTITPKRLLDLSAKEALLPTTSQPNPLKLELLLDFLFTQYESLIVLTVSKSLSGTYNSFLNATKKFKDNHHKISLLDSKQNSGAEGLLVKKCAEYIADGLTHDEIVKHIDASIPLSKILVQVKTLEPMIKSGRLSIKAGAVAKAIGMKPIITLNEDGKGVLENITFSSKGSNRKILQHIKRIMKKSVIEHYSIVHVNNPSGAIELASMIEKIIGFKPDYIMETSSIIAISAGAGAVAISYLLKMEE